MRWTQDRDVPKLRYDRARDPKGRGWHYIWEGGGFGVQVFASGARKWVQCGNAWDSTRGKRRSYFRALGSVDAVKLADARTTAGRVKADAKDGVEIKQEKSKAQPSALHAPREYPVVAMDETTLDEAIKFYIDNRNCAPSSKATLEQLLRKHLADWINRPLLTIDTIMLQKRYKLVIQTVKQRGDALDARYASLSAKERLKRAPPGYHTGIKTGHDVMEGFGRVYRYWTTKHQALLQRAGVLVPVCPTTALVDDLLPQPRRVKSVPAANLRKLFSSFPTYPGNRLHPLLAKLLLASGMRVGIALGCKKEYIKPDRIVIPASVERSKVRWKKRHLEHMAYIIPITPEIASILREVERVAPEYGDAETWLFPSRTSKSGHMEEERMIVVRLREHAGVRFTVHQLRHNVATAAEELGYDKGEIRELLGHSRESVTDRYIDERIARYRKMLMAVDAVVKHVITGNASLNFGKLRVEGTKSSSLPKNGSFDFGRQTDPR
jgi:integrase